jgi:hypothetical protein
MEKIEIYQVLKPFMILIQKDRIKHRLTKLNLHNCLVLCR